MKKASEVTFEEWMKAVDAYCIERSGLSVHDLPDCCFRDWFDDGDSPARAAGQAIKNAMF